MPQLLFDCYAAVIGGPPLSERLVVSGGHYFTPIRPNIEALGDEPDDEDLLDRARREPLHEPPKKFNSRRRNPKGQFKESDDVGRSLSADRRTKAKTRVKSGQGDRGDR